jgi:hypothetical protein
MAVFLPEIYLLSSFKDLHHVCPDNLIAATFQKVRTTPEIISISLNIRNQR